MTDKEKFRAEIERLRGSFKVLSVASPSRDTTLEYIAKAALCKQILSFIDSMQEECNITGIKSRHATGKLKECIDNQTEERLEQARKQLEENPQECMYARDNYTDEDRKILCDGCEEECEYSKKEEPVSEDLEEAIGEYCSNPENFITYIDVGFMQSPIKNDDIPLIIKAFKAGANWQKQKDSIPVSEDLEQAAFDNAQKNYKEGFRGAAMQAFNEGVLWQKQQMMAKAVDAVVKVDAGGYPYIDRTIELYDYDKDIPLAKNGDKVKILVIKED